MFAKVIHILYGLGKRYGSIFPVPRFERKHGEVIARSLIGLELIFEGGVDRNRYSINIGSSSDKDTPIKLHSIYSNTLTDMSALATVCI